MSDIGVIETDNGSWDRLVPFVAIYLCNRQLNLPLVQIISDTTGNAMIGELSIPLLRLLQITISITSATLCRLRSGLPCGMSDMASSIQTRTY
jgi:hypothetical protein